MKLWLGRLRHARRQTDSQTQVGRNCGRQPYKQTDRLVELWLGEARDAYRQTASQAQASRQ